MRLGPREPSHTGDTGAPVVAMVALLGAVIFIPTRRAFAVDREREATWVVVFPQIRDGLGPPAGNG